MTAAFIASGIDPTRHIIFNQSQVSGHAELAWTSNSVARVGWLNRMTQFKEKAGKDRENASAGLYVYPNLMAADFCFITRPTFPWARTRKHLELARASRRSSTTISPRPSRAPATTVASSAARAADYRPRYAGDELARRHEHVSKSDEST